METQERFTGCLLGLACGDAVGTTVEFMPLRRYCAWRDMGYRSATGECFDIGSTTNAGLNLYAQTGKPYGASTDGLSAGNGSIMRLAPVPMFFYSDINTAVNHAGLSPADLAPKVEAIARGEYKDKKRAEISGSGYVIDSLEAALWCFWQTDTYRDAILMAANLGQDADTTAAVCGQIAGAYYGESGIPAKWLELLAMGDEIRELAVQLYEL